MNRALLGLGALLALSACRPTLDGAWEGRAECTETGSHVISALFDEQSDADLRGHWYIENIPFLGAELIVRGDVDDGEYDADNDEYGFDLNTDGDSEPEFAVELEINPDDVDEAEGDIVGFDDAGDEAQTCTFDLDRTSVTNN
jgi:hypothetical protein